MRRWTYYINDDDFYKIQIPNLPLEQWMLESSGTWRPFARRTATAELISESPGYSASALPFSWKLPVLFQTNEVFIGSGFRFKKIANQTIENYAVQEKPLLSPDCYKRIPPALSIPTRISSFWRLFRVGPISLIHMSSQSPKRRFPQAVPPRNSPFQLFLSSFGCFFWVPVRDELCCFLHMF